VPLPPARCRQLLFQGAKTWPVWSHGAIARTAPTVFTGRHDLWLYRSTFWSHNGFKPYLRVRIRETPDGSKVQATVTSWRVHRAVATAWFGSFGFIMLVSLLSFPFSGSWEALNPAAIGSTFLGAYLLMFAFGRLMARRDPERLLGYVRGQLGIIDTAGAGDGLPLPGRPDGPEGS
jgi:hypothetical protein